jgi:hypothetical protein
MKLITDAEQKARDIHGDKFVDELAAEFDEQDAGHVPSFRARTVQKLQDVLESNLAFWIAGFVDGLLVYAFFEYWAGK